MKIMTGIWLAQTLYVAVDLEIFTKIALGKNNVEQIAKDLGIDKSPVERILNVCVASDLLTKENNIYKNNEISERFLVKNKPSYYGDFVLMAGKKENQSWGNLKQSVLNNSPMADALKERMQDSEDAKMFIKAMHNNAIGSANVLSKKFDFSKFTKLLDVGGGSGAYSITLTKEYSNLQAIVFDLPNVCSVANEFIENLNARSKVSIFEGDFFKDEFPKGSDVVLLSQILHSYNEEENKILLKKIYDYLPENGILIINEFLLNEDKSGPLFPALFALAMLINSENGNSYTENEITSWLSEIGFKDFKTIKLSGPVIAIVGKK